MLLVIIFAVLAVVLVAGSTFHPKASEQPMFRVGGYFIGAAFLVLALSFLRNV